MDQQTIAWAKTESRKLARTWPAGGQAEQKLIDHWTRHSPEMVKELKAASVLEEMAHVLHWRAMDAEAMYLKSGMAPTDAREQAEAEWLLMDPDNPNLPPLDQTTSSQIPSN